jgi:hypothetical protein
MKLESGKEGATPKLSGRRVSGRCLCGTQDVPRRELQSPQPVRQDNIRISTKWGLISAQEFAERIKKGQS